MPLNHKQQWTKKMKEFLRNPVILYLLVALTSIIAALILFAAGGSIAEVTGDDNNFVGFGFQAGGALAGFIIILMLSVRVLKQLKEFDEPEPISEMSMKFHLKGNPLQFKKNHDYSGKIYLFNEDTGIKDTVNVPEFRWENQALTADIPSIQKNHLIAIKVKNPENQSWECDYFYARARTKTLDLNEGK